MKAGTLKPPNRFEPGIAGPTLRYLMEYLEMKIARILQAIITRAIVGLQAGVLGTTASKAEVNNGNLLNVQQLET